MNPMEDMTSFVLLIFGLFCILTAVTVIKMGGQLFESYQGTVVRKYTTSYLQSYSGAKLYKYYFEIKDNQGNVWPRRYSQKVFDTFSEGEPIIKQFGKWTPTK
jgi:hypothetical protein